MQSNVVSTHVLIKTQLILLFAWIAVWELASIVEYVPHASVWYPPAALSISAFFLLGRQAALPIVLAVMATTAHIVSQYAIPLSSGQLLVAGVVLAFAHILPYWATGRLIRYIRTRYKQQFSQVVMLTLCVLPLSTLLAALLGTLALVHTNMLPASEFSSAWLPYWIGDMTAALALGPFFLAMLVRFCPNELHKISDPLLVAPPALSTRLVKRISLSLACLLIAFSIARLSGHPYGVFAVFFLVLPHMWIACTESPFTNALSVAVTSLAVVLLVQAFAATTQMANW